MATQTQIGRGIRIQYAGFGDRNFENDGITQYKANRQPLEFLGVKYNVGDLLPYDVGGTSYSKTALSKLNLYWEQGWLTPTV